MLSCLKIDTKVSDVDTETMGSYNCREVSGDDGNANSVLAAVLWQPLITRTNDLTRSKLLSESIKWEIHKRT